MLAFGLWPLDRGIGDRQAAGYLSYWKLNFLNNLKTESEICPESWNEVSAKEGNGLRGSKNRGKTSQVIIIFSQDYSVMCSL